MYQIGDKVTIRKDLKSSFENEKTTKISVYTDNLKTVVVKVNGKTGKAKCAPEDDFDLKTGFDVAYKRAIGEKWTPKRGEYYYVPDPLIESLYSGYAWDNDSIDRRNSKSGLVFKTKEKAIETAKKMLEIVKCPR